MGGTFVSQWSVGVVRVLAALARHCLTLVYRHRSQIPPAHRPIIPLLRRRKLVYPRLFYHCFVCSSSKITLVDATQIASRRTRNLYFMSYLPFSVTPLDYTCYSRHCKSKKALSGQLVCRQKSNSGARKAAGITLSSRAQAKPSLGFWTANANLEVEPSCVLQRGECPVQFCVASDTSLTRRKTTVLIFMASASSFTYHFLCSCHIL